MGHWCYRIFFISDPDPISYFTNMISWDGIWKTFRFQGSFAISQIYFYFSSYLRLPFTFCENVIKNSAMSLCAVLITWPAVTVWLHLGHLVGYGQQTIQCLGKAKCSNLFNSTFTKWASWDKPNANGIKWNTNSLELFRHFVTRLTTSLQFLSLFLY